MFICGAFALFFFLTLAPPTPAQEKVDLLITGGTVLTMDTQRHILDDGAIAVRGDSIVAVGARAELEAKYAPARVINARGTIVMPGLINGHTHAAMSLFRGIAEDLSLDDWLHAYIFPAEARNVTEDFTAWGTRLAILEMLRGGTTTYADMYYFEDAVARVTKEAGMRGVLGETIIDFPAPDNKTLPQAFAYTQKFLDHWKGDPLIVAAVAPHSMYTCSEKTLQDAAALARRNGAPILIHIAEAPFELEQSRNKFGLTSRGVSFARRRAGSGRSRCALRVGGSGGHRHARAFQRGLRLQSVQQYEDGRRRDAHRGNACRGRGHRARHRRRGQQQ